MEVEIVVKVKVDGEGFDPKYEAAAEAAKNAVEMALWDAQKKGWRMIPKNIAIEVDTVESNDSEFAKLGRAIVLPCEQQALEIARNKHHTQ